MTLKFSHVDFAEVGRAVSLERVLDRLGVLATLKGRGNKRRGPCPIHRGNNSHQFHVDLELGVWHCFGNCNRGGDGIGLVAGVENVSLHAAAQIIVDWFGLSAHANAAINRRSPMAGNQTPAFKVFVVEDRESNEDAFWTRIGSAWSHKDGKGYNIVLSALPVNGRIVMRANDDDADDEPAKKRHRPATK